jgi:hypothetical protein
LTETDDPADDTSAREPITLATYRDLRIGLAVTMVMLAAAVIIDYRGRDPRCWQGALSEYFYTTAHSIFIAALLGLATLFFVYRGTCDTEDSLLTLAGVAALVAALVPQPTPEYCLPTFLPADFKVDDMVRPSLQAVVCALALGWALSWVLRMLKRRRDKKDNRPPTKTSLGGRLALYLLRLVVAVGLFALFCHNGFLYYAHAAAGFFLLSSFIATAFAVAFVVTLERKMPAEGLATQNDKDIGLHRPCVLLFYRCFYWLWATVMLLTALVIFRLHEIHPRYHGIPWATVLESAVVIEFAVYWIVQSIDLWRTPDRTVRLSDNDRSLLQNESEPTDSLGLVPGLIELWSDRETSAKDKVLRFL